MNIKQVLLKHRLRTRAAAALLASCFLGTGAAQAAVLNVENASFEIALLAKGGFTSVAPSGWVAFGIPSTIGVFAPFDSQLPPVVAGVQVGYINPSSNGGGIQQTLSDTLESGSNYLLQAHFAYRKDCPALCGTPAFALELLAGDAVLATFIGTNSTFDNQTFKIAALSFDTPEGSPLVGQALTIRIRGEGVGSGQFDFDNVTLTKNVSAVPLPLPAVLLGSALAGLVAVRRRVV